MPKSKSVTQKRRSQRLKQQSPLYKSGLSRTSRISRNTAQETKVNIQQDSLAGCTAIEPLNPNSVLNTPQEIDDAARLFAEFKQTFLPGDTGRIFIKDSKGNFKSHKIVNAELTMRIQNDNKGVEIGSYPFFHAGKLGVSIVIRSEDQNKIDNCNSQILKFVNEKKIEVVDR